jgi:hypothetical protein
MFLNVFVYPAQKIRMNSWRLHISISERSETLGRLSSKELKDNNIGPSKAH